MCTKKVFESSCLQEALDAYTVRSEEKDEEPAEERDPRNPQYPPMDYSRIKRKTLTKDDLELAAITAETRSNIFGIKRRKPKMMCARSNERN